MACRRNRHQLGRTGCALLAPTLAAMLVGCAVGPDYRPPEEKHDAQWQSELTLATSAHKADPANWWKRLHDPVLDRLVDEAVHNNRDVAVALANLDRARALRRVAAGGYFPSLGASGSASHNRFSRQTGSVPIPVRATPIRLQSTPAGNSIFSARPAARSRRPMRAWEWPMRRRRGLRCR